METPPSNPSPLPQPSGATCSNCGAAQVGGAKLCTNCGAAMQPAQSGALHPALKVLLTIPLFLGAVGFGGLGACLGIVSIADIADPTNGPGVGIGFYFLTSGSVSLPAAHQRHQQKEMSETPPLPQPSGATCPNCGAAQSADAPFCTSCGAPMRAPAAGSLSTTSKIIISIALAFGALAFGAVGGCFVLLGAGEGLMSTFGVLIVAAFLAALACVWGIFRIQKK